VQIFIGVIPVVKSLSTLGLQGVIDC